MLRQIVNFRFVVIVSVLFLVCVAASAESYQIRVTWPVRLRASYSLESPIAERVDAGSVLQVTGRYNRWLKIERDGRTAWLADWVDYTHLDQAPAGQGTASEQTPSDIDNCCFVDRQCQTDQEWVDGYWAYQRNECPAPPPLGTSTVSGASHAIRIEGSHLFTGFITEALNRLRASSQKWYDYLISSADLIREDPNTGSGAARLGQRIILIAPYGQKITSSDMYTNLVRVMETLVHEACHHHRYEAGFEYSPHTEITEELACVQKANEMRRDVDPHNRSNSFDTTFITLLDLCEASVEKHPRCKEVESAYDD